MINYIRNLKIRLKLYILIGVALAGMLIIGGMSFFLMGRMNDMTSDISTSWLPSIDTARELTNTLSNIRLNELGYLTAVSDEVEASSLQYLQKEKEDMDALLVTYKGMIDEEESGFYDQAMNLWTQYRKADEEILELAGQGCTAAEIREELERVGELVVLTVADNGAGIPEADLPRIFERFYRVDKARSRAAGGTGPGLSIVRDTVRRHGGWVTARPRSPEGSLFTAGFPRYVPEQGGKGEAQ